MKSLCRVIVFSPPFQRTISNHHEYVVFLEAHILENLNRVQLLRRLVARV